MQLLIKKIELGEEAFKNLLSIANSYYYKDLHTYLLSFGLGNWDTVRISIWLQDISTLKFSTPRLFNHDLFNHEIFNCNFLDCRTFQPWSFQIQASTLDFSIPKYWKLHGWRVHGVKQSRSLRFKLRIKKSTVEMKWKENYGWKVCGWTVNAWWLKSLALKSLSLKSPGLKCPGIINFKICTVLTRH